MTQTVRRDKSGDASRDIVTSATYASSCLDNPSCNRPLTTTDARGNTTDYAYDSVHGGVTSVTAPAGPNGVRPQTRYTYTLTNGEYRLTGTSTCQTQSGAFNGNPAACIGTADEVKTSATYNPDGSMASTASGDGTGALTAATAMGYDAMGNVTSVDGPLPTAADTAYFRYNAARERIGTVSPDPDGAGPLKHRASRTLLDPTSGLALASESGTIGGPDNWSSFVALERAETGYDVHLRPVSARLVDPATGTAEAMTQTGYDQLGRAHCNVVRMNRASFGALLPDACAPGTQGAAGTPEDFGPDRVTRTFFDPLGRVTEVRSAVGTADEAAEARYSYRPNGQVETATDANNNVTTYAYDGHDRLKSTTYPATAQHPATSETLTYESVGAGVQNSPLVASMINRAGETIAFGYDALGRVTVKDVPNSTYVYDSYYRYDNLGRVTSIGLDPVGTTLAFDYDALGRLLKENHTSYGAKTFGYDLAGRRTHMAWKDGVRIDYTYLVTGEMKTIAENAAAVPGAITLATFGYDDRGNRTQLTRGNGTVTDYTPDAVSRLQSLAQSFPASSTNNLQLGFAYNPAGQIASNTRSNTRYSWAGNVAGTTASTPNALNQIATQGGVNLSYDAKGNLTSDGTRSYSYDAENRLATAGTANFYYDPLGRLVWFTGSGGALFDYEGSRLVTEVDGTTYAIRRRFVHGPGSDEPLVWYEGTGTADRRWLHADERGSIVAITDAAGAMTARNRYDEYGLPASTNVGRFQYTGQKWLPQLALYDYKARTYDPRLGRFLQPDPIGYDDGMNMYAYVGGDPVNLVDPSGMCDSEMNTEPTTDDCEITITGTREKKKSNGWFSGNAGALLRSGGASTGGGGGDQEGFGSPDIEPPIVITGKRKSNPTQRRLPFPRRPDPANPAQQPNGCTGVPQLFPASCDAHDVCFGTLGVPMEVCNYEFWLNMKTERPDLKWAARIYYQGVIDLGADYYEDAQIRSERYTRRR